MVVVILMVADGHHVWHTASHRFNEVHELVPYHRVPVSIRQIAHVHDEVWTNISVLADLIFQRRKRAHCAHALLRLLGFAIHTHVAEGNEVEAGSNAGL
jgi:hypothetical protein